MKKLYKIVLLMLVMFAMAIPVTNVNAMENKLTEQAENQIKLEIVKMFPEKFQNRSSVNEMTLAEIESRAGTHSTISWNGATKVIIYA